MEALGPGLDREWYVGDLRHGLGRGGQGQAGGHPQEPQQPRQEPGGRLVGQAGLAEGCMPIRVSGLHFIESWLNIPLVP